MKDYVIINNFSKNGEIGISRKVFEDLATDATNRVIGASVIKNKSRSKILVKLFRPVKVTFHDNGQVEIKISITIKKEVDANKVCLDIQEEVAHALLAYTESVPFHIEIKIESIN